MWLYVRDNANFIIVCSSCNYSVMEPDCTVPDILTVTLKGYADFLPLPLDPHATGLAANIVKVRWCSPNYITMLMLTGT